MNWQEQAAAALGSRVVDVAPLSGGCIGQVYCLWLADGRRVVAKVDDGPKPKLAREGFMLRYLAEQSALPVPAVLHQAGGLLLMAYLPGSLFERVVRFAGQLERWLMEPERPSLIHGDIWTTNVLAVGDQISGFLDPAIYYGHPEIELAFVTLFGTFERPFFHRYQAIRPIAPGFFEQRRDIYNLYPLLVHVRLFGGSYIHSVDQTLQQFRF